MSDSSAAFPTSIEEHVIRGNLNSSLLLNFLMALYLLSLSNFMVTWYFTDWAFVLHGQTRESIFVNTLENVPTWIVVVEDLFTNSLLVISDGLLIWRCYHVWGRSRRMIIIPFILWAGEFGFGIASVTINGLFGPIASASQAALANNITSTVIFLSLGSTLISTSLIAYKIHISFQLSQSPRKRLFNRVSIMIIESAAPYSIVLLFYAILDILPSQTILASPLIEAGFYLEQVLNVTAGLAPTVLVARLAWTNTEKPMLSEGQMMGISNLHFNSSRKTHDMDIAGLVATNLNQLNSSMAADIDHHLKDDVERIGSQIQDVDV
ncbi:hypothetical protein JR316_0012705 [Psilocybe cubensis]|uniref:Uncharacterized protein n=1 Tax=Psilocybe cubensis TaxID=181762 RepID=A0ACB8GJ80_PSICU|nr:hypothetical protein JR316_0012705 [Psilocybe cubensis]KAH9475588.1 hypothetical protein JR316_0012705 [Psilocybe cubensis]